MTTGYQWAKAKTTAALKAELAEALGIELPYPASGLNPNRVSHWRRKYTAFQNYKALCQTMLYPWRHELRGKSNFKLIFLPPDKRRRDLDNALASFKAGIDALSYVSGIDDSKFKLTIEKGDPRKGGAVIVRVIG